MPYGLPVGTDSVSAAILTKISDSLEALRKNETGFVTTGGSANAYTATFSPAHALASDFVFFLRIHATNTGASTLAVNGTAAKNLMKIQGASIVALAPGDVIANGIYQVIRDQTGDRYIVLSRVGQVFNEDIIGLIPLSKIGGSFDLSIPSTANGATSSSVTITHNLGTDDVIVVVQSAHFYQSIHSGVLGWRHPDDGVTTRIALYGIGPTAPVAAANPASGNIVFFWRNDIGSSMAPTFKINILRRS